MNHIKYRPDIDGLRAVAVLAVVGYHAFPTRVTGGFVGVDIFFVISGYLISTIIFGNLEKDSFSYINFYSRRIKRIFPALILVITANWLFGWFILFPYEFVQLGKHVASGIGFLSNLTLWSEAGYFDSSAITKPLLHLWSLGIEEQFYIFWPLLLGLVWRKKYNFLTITLLIAIISFSANIISPTQESMFYLPINRFWEMMIGGILAYITLHKKGWLLTNKPYINIQSLLGAILIVIPAFLLNENNLFPGWWALLPTVGAFLIISTQKSVINQFILSNRVLVYIGLISYPLYLWHWSLISFASTLGYTNRVSRITIVIISFILSWLTYELIEKKIKKQTGFYAVYVLISLSFILIFVGLGTWRGIIPPRNNSRTAIILSEAINDWEYPAGLQPISINGVDVYIKKGAEEKVLFFGDSHIGQFAPRIVKLINQDPVNTKTAIFATRGGCPPIPNVYADQRPECNLKFRETIFQYALSPEVDSVVIGVRWDKYLIKNKKPPAGTGAERFYYLQGNTKRYFDEDGLELALQSLETFLSSISQQKKLFLVIDNPTGKLFDPRSLLGTRITGLNKIENKIYFQEYDKKQAEIRDVLLKIAERTDATVIDPIAHFCKNNQCRTSLEDGTPIYRDGDHLRASYVKQYVDYLDVTVKK